MNLRYVRCSEIIDVRDGTHDSPKYIINGGYPLITSKNINNNKIDFSNVNYISEEDYIKINQRSEVSNGDIIMPMIGTIGNPVIVDTDERFAIKNVALFKLANNETILSKYFYYILKTQDIKRQLESNKRGGTQNFVSLKNIRDLKIPLIDILEQKKIVEILDKAQQFIDKRKEQIEALDELVKSQFIEMFGDPISNPKGFELLTVDDVIEFQGGSQPDKKYFEYKKTDDNIRLIQIRDYKTDAYITYIPKSMSKRYCTADDIMIGRYGPPIFQILKGIEGAYNVALLKATPKMGNKEFIRQFLKQECLFNFLDALSQRTAGQSGIDMPKLRAYPFPYPPIELQNKFSDFVKQVDKLKFEMEKSLKELEDNFNSLMQKAFKGELFD